MSFLETSVKADSKLLENIDSVTCAAAPVGQSLLENFFDKFGRHFSFYEGMIGKRIDTK